jgi:HlyD family secretion protein
MFHTIAYADRGRIMICIVLSFTDLKLFSNRYKYPLLLSMATLGFLAWSLPQWLWGPVVPTVAVVQRDFVYTIVASGHVENPHRVDIGTQLVGTVMHVPVSEGQTVQANQVLLALDNAELIANAKQAAFAIMQARARLQQIHAVQAPVAAQSLVQAQTNEALALRTFQRNQTLFQQGFIGQAALDESHRTSQISHSQTQSTLQQWASFQTGGSELALAESALSQAQAGAELAQARLHYATVQAPVAGTLITRHVEPGDTVQPGKVLMVLSPHTKPQLVLQIDEKHLHLLKLGQSATASVDAYPRDTFAAAVVYINPGVDVQRGSVEIKLQINTPPDYLTQDMTASVDIEVALRPQAILAPTDTIHDLESPLPWVLRVKEGRAHKTPIQIGLRTTSVVEVLGGLGAGDVLIPTNVLTVHDQARVRFLP